MASKTVFAGTTKAAPKEEIFSWLHVAILSSVLSSGFITLICIAVCIRCRHFAATRAQQDLNITEGIYRVVDHDVSLPVLDTGIRLTPNPDRIVYNPHAQLPICLPIEEPKFLEPPPCYATMFPEADNNANV